MKTTMKKNTAIEELETIRVNVDYVGLTDQEKQFLKQTKMFDNVFGDIMKSKGITTTEEKMKYFEELKKEMKDNDVNMLLIKKPNHSDNTSEKEFPMGFVDSLMIERKDQE